MCHNFSNEYKKRNYPGSMEQMFSLLREQINIQAWVLMPDIINQWVRQHWEESNWEYSPKKKKEEMYVCMKMWFTVLKNQYKNRIIQIFWYIDKHFKIIITNI